jgi:glycosyltransferase involved in cell wall biosynthesis
MPAFTIIITTYKRPLLLQRALESVFKQTYTDYECIVVNDNPQDKVVIDKIVSAFNSTQFSAITVVNKSGANYCRNLGIGYSKGDYIAFLDDDDIWFPEKLAEHLKVHTQTNAGLVFSSYIKKWFEAGKPEIYVKGAADPLDIVTSMINGEFSIGTTSSVTLKKNNLPDKLFDESLASFQDWDAWLSIALKNGDVLFKKIDKPLLYFVQHSAERTSMNFSKRKQALDQILNKYQKFTGIRRFYNNELLNINILKADTVSSAGLIRKAYLLTKFFLYPPFWTNLYTLKRTGKYLLKDK